MPLRQLFLLIISIFFFNHSASAGFLEDCDVVWIGPDISEWPETSELTASVAGSVINLDHEKKNIWPISSRFSASERVNASAWGFVKLNDVWHAGTWEYLRAGQTRKSTPTYGGRGHFRPPIGTFRPRNGEIYGFMVAGVSRDTLSGNNVRERTNVVLWKWGVGVVPLREAECGGPPIGPILDLLTE